VDQGKELLAAQLGSPLGLAIVLELEEAADDLLLASFLHTPILELDGAIVERNEYQVAVERLVKAGYRISDGEAGWEQFAELRAKYAATLNQMAHLLAIPPAQGIGDRSYLPHRLARSRSREH
jgi:hypothetical protein